LQKEEEGREKGREEGSKLRNKEGRGVRSEQRYRDNPINIV
jgi:hypothetical protein